MAKNERKNPQSLLQDKALPRRVTKLLSYRLCAKEEQCCYCQKAKAEHKVYVCESKVLQAERHRNPLMSPAASKEPPLLFSIIKGKRSIAGLTYVSSGGCSPAEFTVRPLLPPLRSTNEPDLNNLMGTYLQNLLLNFPGCQSIPCPFISLLRFSLSRLINSNKIQGSIKVGSTEKERGTPQHHHPPPSPQ